jgi:phosphatidylglycerophosphatase A
MANAKTSDTEVGVESLGKGFRRLNVNLPPDVFKDLQKLSRETNRSLTDIVRTGLGLANLALTEVAKSNKIAITDKDGKAIKEIVLIK